MSNLITQTKRSVEKSFSSLINAKLSYLRIAPRKVRLVVDLIRGKTVDEAQAILNFTVKRATHPLLKLLKQAIANAKNSFQTKQTDLYVSKITVDEGPMLKRWRARARGRAFEIKKRTSHITLTLNMIEGKELKKKKKKKEKPIFIKNMTGKPAFVKTTADKEEKKAEKIIKTKKPDFKEKEEIFKSKIKKGKTEQAIKKVFRRKAF